jgi:hypothetical protein
MTPGVWGSGFDSCFGVGSDVYFIDFWGLVITHTGGVDLLVF